MNRTFAILAVGPVAVLLGACAASKPLTGEANPAAEQRADAPRAQLTEDVMLDILVGEIAGQRGRYDIAIASLGRVARKTRDPRLAERATRAAVYAKDYEQALTQAKLWVELQPRSLQAQEMIGSILMELDRPAAAQLHFEQVLSIAGTGRARDRAYRRLASILGRPRNRTAAIEIMQTLVAQDADNPSAHLALAQLAVRADELDLAAQAAGRALELKPQWEEAALFKVGILVSQKDAVAAQVFYEEYLTRQPGSIRVRLNYARYLVDLKRWEKAREQFLLVVQDSPENADALYAVGLLSLQTQRLDEAEQYLKAALRLRPDNQQARIYLGQVAEERKDYGEAERWYGEVVSGDRYFDAQVRLGVVIAKRGDLTRAREFLQAVQYTNDDERVQLVLAEEQVLREAKQYQEALGVLSGALEALPDDKDLLYARALMGEKLDLIELTERDLRAILGQDPDNAQALNALGYTLADRTERYQEALELIERALALKPEDPFILDSMGWVHYRLGNNAEAIRYLNRALAIRNDAEIAAHLGEVLWVTGDYPQAKSVWDKALEQTPDNETLLDVIKKFRP
ncbi:MAG: tetratricopeptide repeat protein [Gammaproteobacteria bacterium]|nr:MAG: tetratricopeptide repeat protein [Gammaproteobacteria bacterium]